MKHTEFESLRSGDVINHLNTMRLLFLIYGCSEEFDGVPWYFILFKSENYQLAF